MPVTSPSLIAGDLAPERPIERPEDDLLGRAEFVRRLSEALISRDGQAARGVVVGLAGPWGSGKSSLLNLLATKLGAREPRPAVVRFDPWLVSGRDDLILALLKQMYATLDQEPKWKAGATKFLDAAAPYMNALGRVAGVGVSSAVDKTVEALKAQIGGPSGLVPLKRAVETALAAVPAPVVVLIDELDRLADAEVRTIAQLVRAVADFPRLSYVLAYDQGRVEEALGGDAHGSVEERRERGRSYLEKLVHLPLPLPVATGDEMLDLLRAQTAGVLVEASLPAAALDGKRPEALLSRLAGDLLETPRDVIRVAGCFRVFAGMVGAEIDAADLLAFSALHAKYPHLTEAMRRNSDALPQESGSTYVRDLLAKESATNRSPLEANLHKAFGPVRPSAKALSLLGFLFPGFSDGGFDDVRADSTGFADYRALATALRLGLPPGTVSRADALRLFATPQAETLAELGRMAERGLLTDVLRRARIEYANVSDASSSFWLASVDFWRASRATWPGRYDSGNAVLSWLPDMAFDRLARRGASERAALRAIADQMLAQRDATILPYWLQSHVLGYGLNGRDPRWTLPPSPGLPEGAFLSADETREMLRRQTADTRSALMHDHHFLFCMRTPFTLFQLGSGLIGAARR